MPGSLPSTVESLPIRMFLTLDQIVRDTATVIQALAMAMLYAVALVQLNAT